jgi:hypothetical protein
MSWARHPLGLPGSNSQAPRPKRKDALLAYQALRGAGGAGFGATPGVDGEVYFSKRDDWAALFRFCYQLNLRGQRRGSILAAVDFVASGVSQFGGSIGPQRHQGASADQIIRGRRNRYAPFRSRQTNWTKSIADRKQMCNHQLPPSTPSALHCG